MRPSLLFSVSSQSLCFFLHLLVALRLRSLRFHSPRLCRVAVFLHFLIQTNVSLSRARQFSWQRQLRRCCKRSLSMFAPFGGDQHQHRRLPAPDQETVANFQQILRPSSPHLSISSSPLRLFSVPSNSTSVSDTIRAYQTPCSCSRIKRTWGLQWMLRRCVGCIGRSAPNIGIRSTLLLSCAPTNRRRGCIVTEWRRAADTR